MCYSRYRVKNNKKRQRWKQKREENKDDPLFCIDINMSSTGVRGCISYLQFFLRGLMKWPIWTHRARPTGVGSVGVRAASGRWPPDQNHLRSVQEILPQ